MRHHAPGRDRAPFSGAIASRVKDVARTVQRQQPQALGGMRLATVVSHDADGTMTVLVGGVGPAVPGVRRAHGAWLPPVGGGVWLAGNRPDLFAICSTDSRCGFSSRVGMTSGQNVANTTDVAVSWDNVSPNPDVFGFWTSGAVMTFPASGRYRASGWVSFAANASGNRQAWLEVNGLTKRSDVAFASAGGAVNTSFPLVLPARSFTVGETLKLFVRQNSGGALSLVEAYLSVEYLGPT